MQRNSFNILYLVLTIQSKVIDQSLDRGPVLGVLWLLFNPATSTVEAPDRRHYNRARPVAESKAGPGGECTVAMRPMHRCNAVQGGIEIYPSYDCVSCTRS